MPVDSDRAQDDWPFSHARFCANREFAGFIPICEKHRIKREISPALAIPARHLASNTAVISTMKLSDRVSTFAGALCFNSFQIACSCSLK
jgi:hypothetical protein